MKFLAIYRASFYLMLTFATLVLSVDATSDNPFAMLYPLAVALAGFLAFWTVDRNPRLGWSRNLASLLALASGILSYIEYRYDETLLLLAAAHWLVYLQLIKTFLPKTVEDDWFLFLLGLVQVLVGGVISQSDNVGMMLIGWVISSVWVLTLFALRREALRTERLPYGSSDPAGADRTEPYFGLFDASFLLATIRVAAITLAMGGLIFLAMPRRLMNPNAGASDTVGKHLSGFDDEVQLGQLGEILENDSVVMSIELVNLDGNRIVPASQGPEQRWRGVTLERYDKGRWRRPKLQYTRFTESLPSYADRSAVIRQLIKLEPTSNPILFGLRPVLDMSANDKRFQPALHLLDGSLFRQDGRSITVDYRIDSAANPDQSQGDETFPTGEYLRQLVAMPEPVLDAVRPIALKIIEGVDPEDIRGQVAALDNYLHGPTSEFRYTLAMDVVDPSLDPVVDFLINRKQGHCEYFATALTLMVRSLGIPSRMINGFKGGDYNAVAGLTTVRQKHAHSWVEVMVEPKPTPDSRAVWVTYDPTPADQRNESVARVGGMIGNFRQLTDLIRYIWVFYIVGFNAERQERFLYAPIRELFGHALRGFGMIGNAVRGLLNFPSFESFFSFKGFMVSFAGLLVLAGLIRLGVGLFRLARRMARGDRSDPSSQAVGNSFFRRLLQLLESSGVTRPAAETPREFARRAAVFLSGQNLGHEIVADVPPLVVDAFYRTRFGDHPLTEADHRHLIARLDALEHQLNQPREASG